MYDFSALIFFRVVNINRQPIMLTCSHPAGQANAERAHREFSTHRLRSCVSFLSQGTRCGTKPCVSISRRYTLLSTFMSSGTPSCFPPGSSPKTRPVLIECEHVDIADALGSRVKCAKSSESPLAEKFLSISSISSVCRHDGGAGTAEILGVTKDRLIWRTVGVPA